MNEVSAPLPGHLRLGVQPDPRACDCHKTVFCQDCGQEVRQDDALRHKNGGHDIISVGCDVCIPEA